MHMFKFVLRLPQRFDGDIWHVRSSVDHRIGSSEGEEDDESFLETKENFVRYLYNLGRDIKVESF